MLYRILQVSCWRACLCPVIHTRRYTLSHRVPDSRRSSTSRNGCSSFVQHLACFLPCSVQSVSTLCSPLGISVVKGEVAHGYRFRHLFLPLLFPRVSLLTFTVNSLQFLLGFAVVLHSSPTLSKSLLMQSSHILYIYNKHQNLPSPHARTHIHTHTHSRILLCSVVVIFPSAY